MKLCACAMAITGAVLWAGALLIVGLINRAVPTYGWWYLKMVESIYPGFHAAIGLKSLAIGVIYALVDGAICGALFAWIYNLISTKCCCHKKTEEQKCA